jgi:chemotaxis protein histidine kinase CheA
MVVTHKNTQKPTQLQPEKVIVVEEQILGELKKMAEYEKEIERLKKELGNSKLDDMLREKMKLEQERKELEEEKRKFEEEKTQLKEKEREAENKKRLREENLMKEKIEEETMKLAQKRRKEEEKKEVERKKEEEERKKEKEKKELERKKEEEERKKDEETKKLSQERKKEEEKKEVERKKEEEEEERKKEEEKKEVERKKEEERKKSDEITNYLLFDTNCYINNLDLVKELVLESTSILVIPDVIYCELDKLKTQGGIISILSCSILPYPILFYSILTYLSYPILSYPILSYSILSLLFCCDLFLLIYLADSLKATAQIANKYIRNLKEEKIHAEKKYSIKSDGISINFGAIIQNISPDTSIICFCRLLATKHKNVYLITNDVNMTIRARDQYDIKVFEYDEFEIYFSISLLSIYCLLLSILILYFHYFSSLVPEKLCMSCHLEMPTKRNSVQNSI